MKKISTSLLFLLLFNYLSAQIIEKSLHDNWQFRKSGREKWFAAKVPGCVHTDLLRNKQIPDPFYRTNEKDLQWIDKKDWEYKTTIEVSAQQLKSDHLELVFKGLDTYADVFLNDSMILKADNMFIGWNIPAKKWLKNGRNSLRIYFHSAVNVGMEKLRKVPYTLMAANEIAPENI